MHELISAGSYIHGLIKLKSCEPKHCILEFAHGHCTLDIDMKAKLVKQWSIIVVWPAKTYF